MGKISKIHAPKVIWGFIIGQMAGFIYSKEFKQRTMDFVSEAVDDVITMAYEDSKNNVKK